MVPYLKTQGLWDTAQAVKRHWKDDETKSAQYSTRTARAAALAHAHEGYHERHLGRCQYEDGHARRLRVRNIVAEFWNAAERHAEERSSHTGTQHVHVCMSETPTKI